MAKKTGGAPQRAAKREGTPPGEAKAPEREAKHEKESKARLLEIFEGDRSLSTIQAYVDIPRLAIVQEESRRAGWKPGSVYLTRPRRIVVAAGKPIRVVPLYAFSEFVAWNDRDDLGEPRFVERTLDPSSETARRARHYDERYERYGSDKRFLREYVEHLHVIVVLFDRDREDFGTLATVEFSRGSFAAGKDFARDVTNVRIDGSAVPMWAQVWRFRTEQVPRPQRACFAWAWEHEGVVDEEDAKALRGRHELYARSHAERVS